MKRLTLIALSMASLTACKSNDINRVVNDGVDGAINGIFGSSGTVVSANSSGSSSDYSVKKEKVWTHHAEKTARNYGSLAFVKTAKNPDGKTRLKFNECKHPRIGNIKCRGYLYEVSPEGWLVKGDTIHFGTNHYSDIVIPAGQYYIKIEGKDVSKDVYATGTIEIAPFVTNYINVTVQ
ncbi:hypothetical protein EAG18_07220 [Pseudoalteromonas sp. J010]|uniref:hypothetical protein n=1 Tax=Pseudoalteromonas sp. J010 TaxID=998465 RepID=UPI000F64865E|nr:hypothetical protein [Pseudoalteromonas sp. J010]RRS09226.1 hypothetical protein EAG18_07220 [Pseudoalteromonas sp. J010]